MSLSGGDGIVCRDGDDAACTMSQPHPQGTGNHLSRSFISTCFSLHPSCSWTSTALYDIIMACDDEIQYQCLIDMPICL